MARFDRFGHLPLRSDDRQVRALRRRSGPRQRIRHCFSRFSFIRTPTARQPPEYHLRGTQPRHQLARRTPLAVRQLRPFQRIPVIERLRKRALHLGRPQHLRLRTTGHRPHPPRTVLRTQRRPSHPHQRFVGRQPACPSGRFAPVARRFAALLPPDDASAAPFVGHVPHRGQQLRSCARRRIGVSPRRVRFALHQGREHHTDHLHEPQSRRLSVRRTEHAARPQRSFTRGDIRPAGKGSVLCSYVVSVVDRRAHRARAREIVVALVAPTEIRADSAHRAAGKRTHRTDQRTEIPLLHQRVPRIPHAADAHHGTGRGIAHAAGHRSVDLQPHTQRLPQHTASEEHGRRDHRHPTARPVAPAAACRPRESDDRREGHLGPVHDYAVQRGVEFLSRDPKHRSKRSSTADSWKRY